MKNLFVPYQIAKKLKEKGFDEPCMAKWTLMMKGDTIPRFIENYSSEGLWFKHNSKDVSGTNGYANGIDFLWSAPMYQQVTDWLRETHKINVWVEHSEELRGMHKGRCSKKYLAHHTTFNIQPHGEYYDVLNKTIEKALELIK